MLSIVEACQRDVGESRRCWVAAAVEEGIHTRGAMYAAHAKRLDTSKCFRDVT